MTEVETLHFVDRYYPTCRCCKGTGDVTRRDGQGKTICCECEGEGCDTHPDSKVVVLMCAPDEALVALHDKVNEIIGALDRLSYAVEKAGAP